MVFENKIITKKIEGKHALYVFNSKEGMIYKEVQDQEFDTEQLDKVAIEYQTMSANLYGKEL